MILISSGLVFVGLSLLLRCYCEVIAQLPFPVEYPVLLAIMDSTSGIVSPNKIS